MKIKRLVAILIALMFAIVMHPSIIIAEGSVSPTNYEAGNEGIEISVSDLSVDPSTVSGAVAVHVTFNYRISLVTSGTGHFKEGDTVRIATNFPEMFDCDNDFIATVEDHGKNELGRLSYNKQNGTVIFTVSKDAESMEYHTFTGTFDSFKHFTAKSIDAIDDYTVIAGIGTTEPARAPFRIISLDRELRVQSSGHGSFTGMTGTVTLNEGDSIEITAKPEDSGDPSNPYQVLKATFIRADKTTKGYGETTLPSSNNVSFRITYDDLSPGLNTFDIAFTQDPIDSSQLAWGFMDYNDVWKNVWGVDYGSYAQNDISIGGAAITNLYTSMGKQLGTDANDKSHNLSNLIIEEHIPGGAAGTIWGTRLAIEAILPNYWPIKDASGTITGYKPFRKEAGRIGDWSGRVYPKGSTDLISAGLIGKIQQTTNETYDQFLGRIKATPLSYGVYIDPETQWTSIFINLGSPGDPNAPGWKCSELWPDQLALDPVLNEINGDDNCIGGKVQAFRLWFYTDHSNVRYTTTFDNKVDYSAVTGTGTIIDRATRTARYTITRDNTLGGGHKSTLTVYVADALDHSQEIPGAKFKLEKWNDDAREWEDAKHEGRTYEGVTDADGHLVLGESDGSVESGTLTPGKYRICIVSLPGQYVAKTMTVITSPSSQGSISAYGEFTVNRTDTKGFVAIITYMKGYNVIYHANGGTGSLDCPNNPLPVGTKAAVLAPGEFITRKNFYFTGWNTNSDGSGSWYAPGSTITISNQDVDLYAQWMPNKGSKTTLSGSKVWNDAGNARGFRPDINSNNGQPIELKLHNLNGYEFPEGINPPLPVWTIKNDDPNTWLYTYEGLPIFDNTGQIITWCVIETPPDNYEATYDNGSANGYMPDRAYDGCMITNTLTKAPYRVEFYYQDRDTGAYPSNATSTDVRKGTIGADVSITEQDRTPDEKHAGWVFDDSNTSNVLTGTVAMDNSIILRVFFKAQYSVTYLPGEHGTFDAMMLDGLSYGDVVPSFTGTTGNDGKPVGEKGWSFVGWYLDNEPLNPDTRIESDMILEAQWKHEDGPVPVQKHTITYKLSGGVYKESTEDITEEYEAGTKITIHAAPTREGFTFLYWKGSQYLPGQEYEVKGNHTFTAIWEENTPVSPDDNQGSSTDVEPDSPENEKEKPAKTGDDSNMAVFFALIALSLGMLTILVIRSRRKHEA